MDVSTSDAPLRIGVVGCGAVTREYHLPAIRQVPGVRITALCDRDLRSAASLNELFDLSALVTSSSSELAGCADMALVAVPPRFHAPVTKDLLSQGLDVLCEKPLAMNVSEADELVQSAAHHRRILAVGLVGRYAPANQLLEAVIENRVLGELQHVSGEYGAVLDWKMTSNAYYDRACTGGGVFFDAGVHLVDRVVSLFGPISGIEFEDDSFGGVESNAVLRGSLRIQQRQVPCTLTFSWTHDLDNSIVITGSAGRARLGLRDLDSIALRRPLGHREVEMVVRDPAAPAPQSPFVAQWLDFARSVRQRVQPVASGASAIAAQRVIETAYQLRQPLAQPWVTA